MYSIKTTQEMGRGLYASRTIMPGEIVTVCELLVFNPFDTALIELTELRFYTFKYNEQQDCICLGDGEIFNHSDEANVSFSLEQFEDRKRMVFRATKQIESGSQLFIDYNFDIKVNTLEYVDKNMVG